MNQPDSSHHAIVVGGGGHAKVVVATLQAAGYTVDAVYDDAQDTHGRNILGVPIVGGIPEASARTDCSAVIAIGDNATRRTFDSKLSLKWATVIHPRATVHPSAKIGEGTIICAGVVVQPNARIGRHVILNTGAIVEHDCTVGDHAHLAPGSKIAGAAVIGEGSLVGMGASILPCIRVGAHSVVGAGSVVTRNVPDDATVAGVPARATTRESEDLL